jgi:hypothetical protein
VNNPKPFFKKSTNSIDRLNQVFVHPYLFAIYPPLFLLVHNFNQVKPVSGLRALLISLFVAFILFAVSNLITKNTLQASLITSTIFILIYLYGPVRMLLSDIRFIEYQFSYHRYSLILWGILLIGFIWLIIKKSDRVLYLNAIINIIGIFLVSMVLFQGILFQFQKDENQMEFLHVQSITGQLDPQIGRAHV